ncbi:glycoside hydrolase family 43 protein [Polluticaenibacter yanchengensis]|uniref:Glycoside hydrolase family 43 protein n=1 Tax=Polluticaenibacter yanchengensis TaxID=3014562 RepID=A0ABT4UP41_9BACT|nr:glycoside hydrolase family 43 protein [Chitinophagaceae bacterium LY-5]
MIRRLPLFALMFSLLSACSTTKNKVSKNSNEVYLFTSFHEPADAGLRMLYSNDGKHWTDLDTILIRPKIGNQKVMRDPSIARGKDGTFHFVWTTSWRGDLGFGYASSKDLINWSHQRLLPVMAHEPTTVNVWAPEIFYDDEEDRFVIIWASCIPGRFPNGQEDSLNNHRMYVTTTKDFKTFTPTQLFMDPGFSVIDCVIVKRGKNDYVLVLKDNTRPERNIKVAFSNNVLGPYTNVSRPFTENFTEGPNVAKVEDGWLIYFDAYRKKTYDAVFTKDFIHFEDANSQISVPKDHKHGTIFKADKSVLDGLLKKYGK